ncbi:STAS domain-containing protein [Amycolatopsis sp. CA-230715]|uniref:STAS domain-containing protein n=1 Tax=Amycolatopsis sp. CA-230715 TaxID=2745196 RepID=UPI001C01FF1F|nr:STAS domain-containing protein [Amycolatopsis sp. CA-230715]QWF81542.1 Anti-sigma-B factor antagonist [Amycolatopsis sp. CA-230715]
MATAETGFSLTVSDGARVVVTGELDLVTSPKLQEALAELVEAGTPAIEADLTGVTFFDSSALNVLLQTQKLVGEREVTLTISPSRQVRRVIDLTGVAEQFTLA